MARPTRLRRVCKEPPYSVFVPQGVSLPRSGITLSVDEYETIRLIDLEGISREECASRMDIARTTAQAIYNSARAKLAECLVNGLELHIEGGPFTICDGSAGCPVCGRKPAPLSETKEQTSMRIAVTYENGNIFQHFGRTEYFKVYEVENNQVVSSGIYSSNGTGHGALAGLLFGSGIDVLICGGIGMGAQNALNEVGITLVAGASGSADDAVAAYLAGTLVSTGANCDHHGHGEHGCGGGDHCCH